MHQSVPNQSAAFRLAALDGPDRPAEKPCRLLVRAALQVAEHDRRTIFLRQPVHLFVDRGIKVRIARRAFDGSGRIIDCATLFVLAPSDDGRSEARRRAASDLIEPWPQRVLHPKRSRLADQDEEGRLKGIFRLVLIANDGQADAPDHRLVPLDKRRKGQLGHLVRIGRESFQELAVGQVSDGPDVIEGSELTNNGRVPSSDYHVVCPHPANRLWLADPLSIVSL